MLEKNKKHFPGATHRLPLSLLIFYINLWILEGAIRKWIPGTEDVFYIFRDLLTIAALLYMGSKKSWKLERAPIFWTAIVGFTVVCLMVSFVNEQSLPVLILGIRSYLAPLIFAYAAWSYGRHEMTATLAKTILFYAPIQGLISIIQVTSSPQAYVNKQVGIDAAHFINGEIVRTSGTFSAPAGLTLYMTISVALILWAIAQKNVLSRSVLIIQLLSIFVSVMLSGSRGALVSTSIVLLVYFVYQVGVNPLIGLYSVIVSAMAVALGLFIVLQFFPQVYESFNTRIVDASQHEDTTARILHQTIGFADQIESISGNGAGVHSQIGIGLGSMKPWVEVESIKWVKELGVVGFIMAFGRLIWSMTIIGRLVVGLRKFSLLHYLICGTLLPIIATGSITQFPSAQAAVSICIGFLILDMRARKCNTANTNCGHS